MENYFVDIDIVRRLYATPDLVIPQIEILNKSFGNLVYQRFLEILYTRMSKGCLVVIDSEGEAETIIETLAYIFGYTIFYMIQDIPEDYTTNYRAYKIPYYPLRRKTDLEKEVEFFNNQIESGKKLKIKTYKDIINYWNTKIKKEQLIITKPNDTILHVSDLHSNFKLLEQLPDLNKYDNVIFYGDYIDGPEEMGSKNLIDLIGKTKSKKIFWLEGNHELRLRKYLGYLILKGSGRKDYIQSYLFDNLPENFLESTALEFSELTPVQAKNYLGILNKKLKMFALIKSNNDVYYICTHAGIRYKEELDPKYIGNIIYRNADINKVDRDFSETNKENNNTYSIHAHCKYDDFSYFKYDKVINIDPKNENEIVYAEQKENNWNICILKKEELN